jgi:putative transposase
VADLRGGADENLDYQEVVHVFLRRRIRAVELYIKLGKRVRPTIRQLGYPTKNSLKGWYREYQKQLDLPVGYAGREPKFSHEQKAAAVAHYLAHDRCIAATIRALGYPGRGTLTAWIREALHEARRSVVGSVGRRRYSGKLMEAGVMELCTREESAQAVADKFGVCRPTLYNWKNQLLGREAPASMKRTNHLRRRKSATNSSARLSRCAAKSGNCALSRTS